MATWCLDLVGLVHPPGSDFMTTWFLDLVGVVHLVVEGIGLGI